MKASPKKVKRAPRSSHQMKTKILVIDTDSMIAEMLDNYLAGKRNFSVLAAESGSKGIELAIEHMPDLILLDTRLNDMSGLDVHEELKHNPVSKNIPIIYVSSFPSLRIIEQATKKGAKGFVTKPFTFPRIYKKMASVLHTS
jgi:two-component system cell cycle response regulator